MTHFSHLMPLGAKTGALHLYQFYLNVPLYSFKGIFTVFYFLKNCVIQTHKNYESALPKAGHCFANEVQILCSSETSKYENLPQVANIQKNTCACEHWWKRVSWFWEILHTWVVLPSFVLVCLILFCFTFFQNFVFERSSKLYLYMDKIVALLLV